MSTPDTTAQAKPHHAAVAVIEPDNITRDSLSFLFESVGLEIDAYTSAEDFLVKLVHQDYACIISEMALPGMDGLELMNRLTALDRHMPTILLSQQNDVSMAVRAMRAGAVDFIEKPFIEPVLLDRVMQVLAKESRARADCQ